MTTAAQSAAVGFPVTVEAAATAAAAAAMGLTAAAFAFSSFVNCPDNGHVEADVVKRRVDGDDA